MVELLASTFASPPRVVIGGTRQEVEGMAQHRSEGPNTIANAAGRTREVHNYSGPAHPGFRARKDGSRKFLSASNKSKKRGTPAGRQGGSRTDDGEPPHNDKSLGEKKNIAKWMNQAEEEETYS